MTFFNSTGDLCSAPGTGAVTISGTPSSGGYVTAVGQIPDGTTGAIRIVDSTNADVFEDCDSVYTASGTTASRGTLRQSSTGSRVNFTNTVNVYWVATAEFLNSLKPPVLLSVMRDPLSATGAYCDYLLGYSDMFKAVLCSVDGASVSSGGYSIAAIKDTLTAAPMFGSDFATATIFANQPTGCADNGTRLFVFSGGGFTSPGAYSDDNGLTWQSSTGFADNSSGLSVFYNADEGVFVVIGYDGSTANASIWVGDGATFTQYDSGIAEAGGWVKGVWDGTQYCVAFYSTGSSLIELYTVPPDGSVWAAQTLTGTFAGGVYAFDFDGTNYVILAYDNIVTHTTWAFYGTDITALSAVNTTETNNPNDYLSLAHGNGLFVWSGYGAQLFWVSSDGGATWNSYSGDSGVDSYSVAFNTDKALFVALNNGVSSSGTCFETSPDGQTWTPDVDLSGGSAYTFVWRAANQWYQNAPGTASSTVSPTGFSLPASENLAAGDLVNIWDNGGNANVRKADASIASAGGIAHGFVLSAVSSPANATVFTSSQRNNSLSGMTPATKQYLSDTTPGATVETAPSTSGYAVQPVGISISTTTLIFQPELAVVLA